MPVKPGQFDGPAEGLFAGIGEERRISLARRSGELPVYCSRKHCAGLYNPRVEVESEQIRDPQANQFLDRKSTRLNSSHLGSRMPSSA